MDCDIFRLEEPNIMISHFAKQNYQISRSTNDWAHLRILKIDTVGAGVIL